MKRAILALLALALLIGGGHAKAGFIYGTASVTGDGDTGGSGPGSGLPLSDGPRSGFPVSASAANTVSQGGNTVTGSGRADVNLIELPGFTDGFTWQLHTEAHASVSASQPFASGDAHARSQALFQDVLFLSNTDPLLLGHTLRLNFQATFGSDASALPNSGNGIASTGLTAQGTNISNPSPSDFASTTVGSTFVFESSGTPGFSTSGPWDTLTSLGNGFYKGTFHLDIPIVPGAGYIAGQPGSFFYSMSDISDAFAVTGQPRQGLVLTAQADAADPMGFMSITLPDVGNVTPESLGVSVTFASGIVSPNLQPSASAAPEPSTLTLLGIGAVCSLGCGWRRRNRVKQ